MIDDAALRVGRMAMAIDNPLIFPLVAPPARPAIALLWALDRRLAHLARSGHEVVLRQTKLRWWADQLGNSDVTASGEPLVRDAAQQLAPVLGGEALTGLAEAWMAAADPDAAQQRGESGARLFTMTGTFLGLGSPEMPPLRPAGQAWWCIADAVARDDDAADWQAMGHGLDAAATRALPRALAALVAQARGIAARSGARSAGREQISILRAGLFGR